MWGRHLSSGMSGLSVLQYCQGKLRQWLGQDGGWQTYSQVPLDTRESFILTGYRPVASGFLYSLRSAFSLHNETLNFWTHSLPVIYFLYYMFWEPTLMSNVVTTLTPPQRFPVYGYWVGVLVLFLFSSGAHLVNCAWSKRWRNVCFVLDYAAIVFFGISSALAYFFLLRPKVEEPLGGALSFFSMTVGGAVLALFACCWTRLRPSAITHALRIFAFALPCTFGSTPAFQRYYQCEQVTGANMSSLVSSVMLPDMLPDMLHHATQDTHMLDLDCTFQQKHIRHYILLVTGSAFNVIKIPERFWPGKFDLVGHSHQIFHVFVYLSIKEQFWLLMEDIFDERASARIQQTVMTSSPVFWTVTTLGMTFALLVAVIIGFAYSIPNTPDSHCCMSAPSTQTHTRLLENGIMDEVRKEKQQ